MAVRKLLRRSVDHWSTNAQAVQHDQNQRRAIALRNGNRPRVDLLRDAFGFVATVSKTVQPDGIIGRDIHHSDPDIVGFIGED